MSNFDGQLRNFRCHRHGTAVEVNDSEFTCFQSQKIWGKPYLDISDLRDVPYVGLRRQLTLRYRGRRKLVQDTQIVSAAGGVADILEIVLRVRNRFCVISMSEIAPNSCYCSLII